MGIFEKWTKMALDHTPKNAKFKFNNNFNLISDKHFIFKLTLKDLHSVFLVWFIGILLSLITFIIEYYYVVKLLSCKIVKCISLLF